MNKSEPGIVADTGAPGRLIGLVSPGLSSRGIDIRRPSHEEDTFRVRYTRQGMHGDLFVTDSGYVEWEVYPVTAEKVNPQQIADLVSVLLAGDERRQPRQEPEQRISNITLKGVIGRELRNRKLDVELEIYKDEDYFDTQAVIVVTNPAEPAGKVMVSDEGYVTWQRDYWPEAAMIRWHPDYADRFCDHCQVAETIVETVTRAMSHLMPDSRASTNP